MCDGEEKSKEGTEEGQEKVVCVIAGAGRVARLLSFDVPFYSTRSHLPHITSLRFALLVSAVLIPQQLLRRA